MRLTYAVTAQLRMDKLRADNCAPLYWFLRVGAHVKKIPTGKFLAVAEWNKKNKSPKTNTKHGQALKNWLDHKIDGFYTAMLEYERMDKVVTSIIAAAYFDEHAEVTLFNYWESHMEALRIDNKSINTLKSYRSSFKILKEFSRNLNFHDLTTKTIRAFDAYLKNERGNSLNGRFPKMKNLKAVLNAAKDDGYIKENPFDGFAICAEKVTRQHLTIDEVNQLAGFKIPADMVILNRTKDIFLFGCYTGLRFSDVLHLRTINIKCDKGLPRLEIKVIKTKRLLTAPLPTAAIDLITKYTRAGVVQDNDFVFPRIANPTINRGLKDLMKLVGIDKNISFHCSRHSFAVNHIEVGTDLIYIKELLGHTDIEQTQIYARATKSHLFKSMSTLESMYQ